MRNLDSPVLYAFNQKIFFWTEIVVIPALTQETMLYTQLITNMYIFLNKYVDREGHNIHRIVIMVTNCRKRYEFICDRVVKSDLHK